MKRKKTPAADLETIMPIIIGVWRRMRQLPGPPDVLQTREFRSVVQGVQQLQSKTLEDGTSIIGTNYFDNPELLGSYLLYQWVLHYQEGLSLIGELPFTPKRVLDVCSGGAPFAFAAIQHGATDVYATDMSMKALEMGAQILGRYGNSLAIRKWNCLKESCPVEGSFDLIILGHALDDLFPDSVKGWREQQDAFIQKLLKRLSPEGCLLIVDSSQQAMNHRVLFLRDTLVAAGVPVQAPCVWKGECVALKANSLCYAQREMVKPYLIREIQRAASINLGSLKMSYLIVRRPDAKWPVLPEGDFYRVISPPVESHHGVRYFLCGTDGKKNLGSRLTLHPASSKAFEYLKRGELIKISDALVNSTQMDVVEGTTITMEAACGKPIKEVGYGD